MAVESAQFTSKMARSTKDRAISLISLVLTSLSIEVYRFQVVYRLHWHLQYVQ